MAFKGSFSFKNENITETTLGDGVIMRVAKVGAAVARLYFVDDNQVEIAIPVGFQILDITNQIPVAPIPGFEFFVLAWVDSYQITYNNDLVLDLRTQRQWSLAGPREREVRKIEN